MFFSYQLQLVGGPDDGATFGCRELPPFWEVIKAATASTCDILGVPEFLGFDRYWRSDKVTEDGTILYYYEDLYEETVTA